ncbi:MAG: serine/threonine-protein kinase [Candidatus Eisenbacteria bacterium]
MDRPATQTIGRYQIESRLGSGGSADVFRAWDPELQRAVAIKRLRPGTVHEERERILAEARVVARLRHPGIVPLHDVLLHESEAYLVEGLVFGETLRDRLARGLRPESILAIAQVLLDALAHTRAAGVVHGDLKPENIMVAAGDHPCIVDFGLARRLGAPELRRPASTTDSTEDLRDTENVPRGGTPAYMAPEVIRGALPDAASDLWSLGLVLYESIAGRNPFQRELRASTLAAVLETPIPELESIDTRVPREFCALVQSMLARDPAARPRDLDRLTEEVATLRHRLAANFSEPRSREASDEPSYPAPAVALAVTATGEETEIGALAGGLLEAVRARLAARAEIHLATGSEAPSARYRAEVALHPEGSALVAECRLSDRVTRTPLAVRRVRGEARGIRALEDALVEQLAAMLRAVGVHVGPAATAPELAGFDHALYLRALGYLREAKDADATRVAIGMLEEVVASDHQFAPALAALARAKWRLHLEAAEVAAAEEAERLAYQALAIAPRLAAVQATLGTILLGAGKPAAAIQAFEEAIASGDLEEATTQGYAKALAALHRFDEAVAALEAAIRRQPDRWRLYNVLGSLQYEQSRFAEARDAFRRAVTLAPDYAIGFVNLGAACQQLGAGDQAIAAYRRAIAIKPSRAALTNLGVLLMMERRHGEAIQALRDAIAIEAGDYRVWANLGAALEEVDRTAEALDAYREAARLAERARRINPNDRDLTARLAQYHLAFGEKATARNLLESEGSDAASTWETCVLEAAAWDAIGEPARGEELLIRAIALGCSIPHLRSDPGLSNLLARPNVAAAMREREAND